MHLSAGASSSKTMMGLDSFEDLDLGKELSQHYTDFHDETLLDKVPVGNWPKVFGQESAKVLIAEGLSRPTKVLVLNGDAGRSTLELLRNCSNLKIDHTDPEGPVLDVLETLLLKSRIRWLQRVEGLIADHKEFHIEETRADLLDSKDNAICFKKFEDCWTDHLDQSDLKDYDAVVADIRTFKGLAPAVALAHQVLRPEGVLILGMVGDHHLDPVLEKHFRKMNTVEEGLFPHIFKETRNKHQYAISSFSAWRKSVDMVSAEACPQGGGHVSETGGSRAPPGYYEDSDVLASYDRFHFGQGLLGVENFPLRMAEICLQACRSFRVETGSALDAGCGPGRTALELCSVFNQVEAYDYSQSFVDMLVRKKAELGIENLRAYQGDSHRQDQITGVKKFDLIHGCNLIDRLHDPKQWVVQSKEMLKPGGLLVISSPYTWMEQHTPLDKWIGGFKRNGQDIFTADGLEEILKPELELLEVHRVPFVIPDADGTFQYTYSNCTIFGTKT